MNDSLNHERISVVPRVRSRAVAGDGVLVNLDSGRVIVVNEVGLHIVQLLDIPMTRQELSASVVNEFDVSTGQAETDIDSFIAELDKEQLLQRHV